MKGAFSRHDHASSLFCELSVALPVERHAVVMWRHEIEDDLRGLIGGPQLQALLQLVQRARPIALDVIVDGALKHVAVIGRVALQLLLEHRHVERVDDERLRAPLHRDAVELAARVAQAALGELRDHRLRDEHHHAVLLRRGFEPGGHVHVRREVRGVHFVGGADRALDRPPDVQAEAHVDLVPCNRRRNWSNIS